MTSNNTDFCCSDCTKSFECASLLLLHFALHVSQSQYNNINSILEECKNKNEEEMKNNELFNSSKIGNVNIKDIPDLYPISTIKNKIIKTDSDNSKIENFESNLKNKCLTSQNTDFLPVKFCSATLNEKPKTEKVFKKKKYACNICSKVFGWSTDLKRHLLTHSGERPFKCKICDACFTRNFVLQKHIAKAHDFIKDKMPNLKPIIKNDKLKNKLENFNQINVNNLVENNTLVQ